mmetsp:Transcript_37538/g.70070  ORF Transcript_37538/g.70070 Transcript_37538/m.70070 type:complete len:151 (-) Transcript_37538:58-510(-)
MISAHGARRYRAFPSLGAATSRSQRALSTAGGSVMLQWTHAALLLGSGRIQLQMALPLSSVQQREGQCTILQCIPLTSAIWDHPPQLHSAGINAVESSWLCAHKSFCAWRPTMQVHVAPDHAKFIHVQASLHVRSQETFLAQHKSTACGP